MLLNVLFACLLTCSDDIFSLDPEYVKTLPRAAALIVTISTQVYYRRRANDPDLPADSSLRTQKVSADSEYSSPSHTTSHSLKIQPPNEPLYVPQTIGHACGLISLLHALCNTSARDLTIFPAHTPTESLLSKFIVDTQHKTPAERAAYLYNSAEIEEAHMSAAKTGDTVAPPSEDPNGNHFITFVKVDGKVWELEGSRKVGGPICRGAIENSKDVLDEEALNVTIRPFLAVAEGNMEFSMVGMGFEHM